MDAILLCAGTGKRFRPLSYITPKPLTVIHGQPLVEHTIQLLRRNGINRISIVTGYMPEKFSYLQNKYSAELVYNPLYASHNNNSSLSVVKDRLEDALIIDGDLFITKDFFSCIQPGKSQFISQPTVYGKEWELLADADGRVTGVKKWSESGYAMSGVSYWQGREAALLADELQACAPEEYWEDAAIRVLNKAPVYVSKVEQGFLIEVDSVMDALHQGLLNHAQIAAQASYGQAPLPLKGLTNHTWLIQDHEKVLRSLRIPGRGTEKFIKREEEAVVLDLLKNTGLTPETSFYPLGIKTTRFLSKHHIATHRHFNKKFFTSLAAALDKMHSIGWSDGCGLLPVCLSGEITKYEKQSGMAFSNPQRAWMLEKAAAFDAEPAVLSHRDLLLENIMVTSREGENLQLIDFEYAGFTHVLWDPASFILESGISGRQRDMFIAACGVASKNELIRLKHMEILVDYIWGLWGMVNNYHEYGEMRLARCRENFENHS